MADVLKFVKLSTNAYTPTKATLKSAGYDLRSAYSYIIPAKGKQLIKTDLKFRIPPNCYGRIAPRSGLALHHFIDVGGGVIDEDYHGNVGIILFNHNNQEFEVKKGDKIAQMIIERIYHLVLEESDKLSDTERQEKGFGSGI